MTFLTPKWPNFDHFHQKWPILNKFNPLMTFLTKLRSINLGEIIFRNFRQNFFWPLSPNFDLWHHFPQKWPHFYHFHQKWPILTKFTPLMTLLTKFMSINLAEIIFRIYYGKYYFTVFHKFWHMMLFWPPKGPNF